MLFSRSGQPSRDHSFHLWSGLEEGSADCSNYPERKPFPTRGWGDFVRAHGFLGWNTRCPGDSVLRPQLLEWNSWWRWRWAWRPGIIVFVRRWQAGGWDSWAIRFGWYRRPECCRCRWIQPGIYRYWYSLLIVHVYIQKWCGIIFEIEIKNFEK